MTQTGMERFFPIGREDLDESHYMQSLLQRAVEHKLMSPAQLQQHQTGIARLLQRQLLRYTHGDSSSVKVETALGLMNSLAYTIGVYLKSLPGLQDALEALATDEPSELMQRGKELIAEKTRRAKALLTTAQDTRIAIENEAYRQTLDSALPDFFTSYEPEFAAHETPCMIDYPLCADPMQTVGIEYIEGYIDALICENTLCSQFSQDDITCLLQSYHADFRDLLINLYELTFANAAGCILLGKAPYTLALSAQERDALVRRLSLLPEPDYRRAIDDALRTLTGQIGLSQDMHPYLPQTAEALTQRLDAARKDTRLPMPFTVFIDADQRQGMHFHDGDKMSDDAFRAITAEVRACRFTADKLSIIHKHIRSFGDLADLLGADCLFDDEYHALFDSLGETELALLNNLYAQDEEEELHLSENQREWQRQYTDYLQILDSAKRKEMLRLAARLAK
ncbi:MAG: DUF6179 domain-containing protein [Acetanaerobacterium sp.]